MAQDQSQQINVGVNQSGVRDYNERLLLSMIQHHGAIAGSELAKLAGLSAQTVSVILRRLEQEKLILRGDPKRGKVGKPSVPMEINADGAFSIGLKIGRRSAELALMDLHGRARGELQTHYPYPTPDKVFSFLRDGMGELLGLLPEDQTERVFGIGICKPLDLWEWHEYMGAPQADLAAWKDVDFIAEIARFTDLAVFILNDATAACYAENVFGAGRNLRDYAYFFVGSFIGGGVVMNRSVVEGNFGNAGALGPLQSIDRDGNNVQLLDTASLHILERAIEAGGGDPQDLWRGAADWSIFGTELDDWIEHASREIARAALSACAVIDFGAIVIDGAFPEEIRRTLVARVAEHAEKMDKRGLIAPEFLEGEVGPIARVAGAAYVPIAARYFLTGGLGMMSRYEDPGKLLQV